MPLINYQYFVGEINIPGTDSTEVADRLNFMILKREEELLRALLGNELYDLLAAEIVTATYTTRFDKLIKGETYTDACGDKQRWIGLAPVNKVGSLVANYVYYWWLRDKASNLTKVGMVLPVTDGSTNASVADKQSRAWNEMAKWIDDLFQYLTENADDFPEWVEGCDQYTTPINAFNL